MIWQKAANKKFKLKNWKPMTHGGGSLMVWGCISSKGVN